MGKPPPPRPITAASLARCSGRWPYAMAALTHVARAITLIYRRRLVPGFRNRTREEAPPITESGMGGAIHDLYEQRPASVRKIDQFPRSVYNQR